MTLIEMLVIIVVIGMAVPAMLTNFASLSLRAIRSEAVADAVFHAEQLMEEITARPFVDPDDKENTLIGPNSGESYQDFDDIDDYNGYPRISGAYTMSAAVSYVTLNTAKWVESPNTTDFKRVRVTVKNDRNMVNMTVETIISPY